MTKLWPHQIKARDFMRPRDSSLVAAAMGCGKSAICTTYSDEIEAHRMLFITPTSVRNVWRREIPKHSNREVDLCILDHGSVRKRTATAAKACQSSKPVAVVVNYEATFREPMRSWLLSQRWDMATYDESHRIQRCSHTANFASELRSCSDKKLCLSGSPLTKDPASVWGQCRFLDPSLFGEDLEKFLATYHNQFSIGLRKAVEKRFRETGEYLRWPEWMLSGVCNEEEYLEKLSTIAFRVENDVLNLPPLTIEKREFQLSAKARDIYNLIQDDHIAEIETGVWADARGSYATTMRLQQITSGWIKDTEDVLHEVDTGKRSVLMELLSETSEPVVVYARFVRDLDIVRDCCQKLGLLYGEISQRRKDGITDLAEMAPNIDACGVQEQAGGAGIDLTRARIGIDFSPSWRLELWDQKIARIHRPPASRPVIVYEIVCHDSIDEEIYRALDARRAMVSNVWQNLASPPKPSFTLPTGARLVFGTPRLIFN